MSDRRSARSIAFGLALLLAFPAPAGALFEVQAGPDHESGRMPEAAASTETTNDGPAPVRLSLRDTIRRAVEGNLDIRVGRLSPEQAEQDEIASRAFYDPNLFFNYLNNKENQRPTNFLATSSSEFDNYTLGVRQQFTTGMDASLTWNNSRFDQVAAFPISFNPSYSSNLSLSFSQPLLRGRGAKAQNNAIEISRNGVLVSKSELSGTVMDAVRGAIDAYWELAAAISNLRVARESLSLANDLLDLNRAKVEVGTLAPIEITQAEAGVASREESVIVAESAIRTAEDNLRRVLNAPRGAPIWARPIEPADEPPFVVLQPDMQKEIATAMSRRPDLEQQRLQVRNLELQAATDRNGVLPQLDLTGTYGLSGVAGDQRFDKCLLDRNGDGTVDARGDTRDPDCLLAAPFADITGDGTIDDDDNQIVLVEESVADAWEQITDRDLVSWSVGVNFSIPVRNRAAKARYAKSRITLEQSRLGLQNAELGVEIDVRNAVRQVETNIKRVQVARANVALQKEKLEAEQKRFQYGMTTSFQVLEFQNDLTEAESSEIRAVIDYNKSLAALARSTGTLLEKENIVID